MKHILRVSLLSLAGLSAGSSIPALAAAQEQSQLIDSIAAVVDEGIILVSEFRDELQRVREQISRQGAERPPENVLREQVLESLISRELQLMEAQRRGITVDDISLNETLRSIASRNGLSLDAFRRQLQADGISYQSFREGIREDMTLNQLRQQVINSRVVITEQEVDDFLGAQQSGEQSRYQLSHIQVAVSEDADTETSKAAEEKAESLYQQLLDGADFEDLAVAESDGGNALEGGDLGWRTAAELPPQFAQQVRRMTTGDISKPFATPRGYHILKLRDTEGVERHFVKQVHARHILITPDELTDDDEVRYQLADIREQIADGADFNQLARQYSDDPGSAELGGDLGWAAPEQYSPKVREVMQSLPRGKISEPFKSRYGWHIVQVLGWREHEDTIEHQRNQARQALYERKARIEEELWVRQLRDEAYVDVRIDI